MTLTELRTWRERLQQGAPRHYCPRCTSLVYKDDERCRICDRGREEGWSDVHDSPYHWLGHTVGGRYVISQLLGQGASAQVYRVESLTIPRPFAMKIVKVSATSHGVSPKQLRARLDREIEALSTLNNPHIVPLYEVLDLEEDTIAIVMDFVEGITLERLVRHDGDLSVRRACGIIRQIANGLCEVHDKQMIHRDLKPENVMLLKMASGDEFARILDFGAVWLGNSSGTKLTQGFLGTPMYSSPEQVLDEPLDHRSDIYALGAIFFFLLTGEPPFDGENLYEVLRRHVDDIPRMLNDVLPEAHFPAPLEHLVQKMLAKDPDERPQHLLEVIESIDDLYRDGFLTDERTELSFSFDRSIDRLPEPPSRELMLSRESAFPHMGNSDRSHDGYPDLGNPGTQVWTGEGDSQSSEGSPDERSFVSPERDHTGPKAAILRRSRQTDTGLEPLSEAVSAAEPTTGRRRAYTPHRSSRPEPNTGSFDLDLAEHRNKQEAKKTSQARPRLDGVRACALSSASRFVAIDWANRIYGSSPEGSGYTRIPYVPPSDITAAAIAVEHTFLGLADGGVVRVNEQGDGDEVFRLPKREDVLALACSANGQSAIVAAATGQLFGCRNLGSAPWELVQLGLPVDNLAMSQDGLLFAVLRDERITLHQIESPDEVVHQFDGLAATALNLSEDGELLGVMLPGGKLKLFHVASGRKIFEPRPLEPPPCNICFSTQQQLLGLYTEQGTFRIANLQSDG